MFESDLLPEQEWRFGAEEAAKITQPVLFLSGAETRPAAVTEVRDLRPYPTATPAPDEV